MVKNTGGNKTKGAARKLMTNRPSTKLRKAESEEEKYAYVTKICGGRICHVKTLCGIELLCHIRGKFSGRNKSSNFIAMGSLLLIGIRDFGKNECDVIEVYNPHEVDLLKQMPDVDLSDMHKYSNPFRSGIVVSSSSSSGLPDDDDLFDFRRTKTELREEEAATASGGGDVLIGEGGDVTDEIINIDDI
jgi:initiation factor 1A